MSIIWKQWLCWIKIILTGLKTFRMNGKLIISNFTLIALQCRGFFQINSYFLHKRGLQIVIAENTSLLSEKISFCLWNWISSPSSIAIFHWTIKQCKYYIAARWDWSGGPGKKQWDCCMIRACKVHNTSSGTLLFLRAMVTEPGILDKPGK